MPTSKSISRNVPSALPWPLPVAFHSLWSRSGTYPQPSPSTKPGVVVALYLRGFCGWNLAPPLTEAWVSRTPKEHSGVFWGWSLTPGGAPLSHPVEEAPSPSVPLWVFRWRTAPLGRSDLGFPCGLVGPSSRQSGWRRPDLLQEETRDADGASDAGFPLLSVYALG